jgi:hypothetical protein
MTPNGAILYQGPSRIDGKPIAVVLTGLNRKTKNTKTGDMRQLWIMRSDIPPVDAVTSGDDQSVCGDCPLRPISAKRTETPEKVCYVTTIHAPRAIYLSLKRGDYPVMAPSDVPTDKPIRIGAYGDPGAVPTAVWRALPVIAGRTGYTHQWTRRPSLRTLVMASVDSPTQATQARVDGWRTFRVKTADQPLMDGEIACPASAEAGKRTNCASCLLCDGKTGPNDRRANIAINVH